MATAARGTVGFIPETLEEQRALDNLRASRQALQDALLNRKELFDPTLLAIAQGFLAPTKSGGFGESLGNVAAQVGPVQQKERERELQMFQIRAELAAQEAAEAQAMQEARLLRQMPSVFGGAAPPPAAAGAPAAGTTAGATPGAAPGVAPSGEVSTANRNQILQYVENLSRSRSPALRDAAKQTLDLLKFQRDGIEMREGIVIDKNRVDANGMPMILADLRQKQEPTEIVYQGKPRTIMMTGLEIQGFKTAKEQGPEAEKRYFDTYLAGRRSGPEAMPFGGERISVSVQVPDPQNPGSRLTFSGTATPRNAALLESMADEARKTGNYSELLQNFTEFTGVGSFGRKPGAPTPSAAPAAAPAAPSGRPAAQPPSARDAAIPPPTPNEQAIMERVRAASAKMADAVAKNDVAGERAARNEISSLRAEISREQGVPAGLAVDQELVGLPIAEQNKIITQRIQASEKEASDQMALIRQIGSPQQIVASNNRLKEIREIAMRSPEAMGLLVQQGLLTAIGKAANEGLVRVGSYTLSFPVESFLTALKLPTHLQEDGRRMAMLLDEEFFNRANSYKSVLGPQISNAETILMKSPLARPSDSARVIAYWATHGLLTNRQIDDLYESARRYPGNRSPKDFIGSDVRRIMDSYTPLFERIRQDFATRR